MKWENTIILGTDPFPTRFRFTDQLGSGHAQAGGLILFGLISLSDHISTKLDPRNTVTAALLALFLAPQQ